MKIFTTWVSKHRTAESPGFYFKGADMISKISFKISQNPDANGEHLIYLVVNWGHYKLINGSKRYYPLKYSTGEKVNPKKWKGKSGNYRIPRATDINTNLQNYEDDATEIVKQLKKKDKLSNANIKIELDRIYNPTLEIPAATLNQYIQEYIEGFQNGTRLNDKQKRISPGTVKIFRTFQNVFNEFQQKRQYDFNDIDLAFYKRYTGFLAGVKNYAPNTIGRHVKHFKMIMRAAMREDLHTNTAIDKKEFKVIREDTEQIYLNDAEVRLLYDLDLSKNKKLDRVRDVFLVGCYTLQRFSDYSKIKKDNLRNGYIHLTQQKTGKRVVIPVKPELRAILIKHDWSVPYTYEQELNSNIKLIARMANIIQPVVRKLTTGGVTTEETSTKNTLISSHTARRSGCTNLYVANVPTLDIMKISGHKTEKEFLRYIRISEEETAKKVSTHPWFSQEYSPLKVAR